MANYADYDDVINDIKGRYEDSSSDTNTAIRRKIAPVLWDIFSRARWKFARKTGTITTTASTQTYSLASDYDFGGIYDVVFTTDQKILSLVSARDIDSLFPGLTTEGSPDFYFLWPSSSNAQQIGFYPIPDTSSETITYRYYRKPTVVDLQTDTSNDDETPDLPQHMREALVFGVLYELYKKDESQLANVNHVDFENLIARRKAQYADEPDELHVYESSDSITQGTRPSVRYPTTYGPYVNP